MNMFGFSKEFLNHLENAFDSFLIENQSNLDTAEFFLPTVVSNLITQNKAEVSVLNTTSVWQGITYKQDKEKVSAFLKDLTNKGYYPKNLWGDNF